MTETKLMVKMTDEEQSELANKSSLVGLIVLLSVFGFVLINNMIMKLNDIVPGRATLIESTGSTVLTFMIILLLYAVLYIICSIMVPNYKEYDESSLVEDIDTAIEEMKRPYEIKSSRRKK